MLSVLNENTLFKPYNKLKQLGKTTQADGDFKK